MLKEHLFRKGFTMVEMLIVCAIFFVATTAGAISFSRFNTSQAFDSVSKNMVSFLNNAKGNAVTQTMPSSCLGLNRYSVKIILPSDYEIWIYCNTAGTKKLKSEKLPDGIIFKSGTSSEISFMLGNGISSGGQILIGSGSVTKTIKVDTVGNITIQ